MGALTGPNHRQSSNRADSTGSEAGDTLIQALVALAIVGITIPAFLGALSTSSKATIVARDRTVASTIARAHVEFILGQDYSTDTWDYTITTTQRTSPQQPSWWDASSPPLLDSTYDGYRVETRAENFDADGDTILEIPGDDSGVRKVTVEVYSDGPDPLSTVETHKADL